jgi:hypothetical protein
MKFTVEQLQNGRIFNVTFTKANGEARRMNARLGVKNDAKLHGNLIVYSMSDKGYRTVKLGSILTIKCNGNVYTLA